MMILYGIPNCNTVKKAQDWLRGNGQTFDFHDFKKKGITAQKLTQWCETFGWEKVLNRAGLTFKKLSKEEQADINNQEKAIAYLLGATSAIKRPIVEIDGKAMLLGFKEEEYQKAFL
jgi:arsenate reductase